MRRSSRGTGSRCTWSSSTALEPDRHDPHWSADNVELLTVGIDIGSATSHLTFSKVHLRRETQSLSSRFVVVERTTLYRSPIVLTPYRDDDESIDAAALGDAIDAAYAAAEIDREDVDSGSVILTGVAIERRNARAIAEMFAAESGRFVCASAGHKLECALAAHGSGAVALSTTLDTPLLHVDVGGGTAKLALLEAGAIHATAAIAVGSRLVTCAGETVERVEDAGARTAAAAGLDVEPGRPLAAPARRLLAETLASALLEAMSGDLQSDLARSLLLTEAPAWSGIPPAVSFSGGVAEYVYGHETRDFGDLAHELATAIAAALRAVSPAPDLLEPPQRIRATAIGAAQFTVQVSGNTVSISEDARLPVHGLPVLRIDPAAELDAEEVADALVAAAREVDLLGVRAPAALAFSWRGAPSHARLHALADGIVRACDRGVPTDGMLLVLLDGDVARSLGGILRDERPVGLPVVCLDGLELRAFDYVDVGAPIEPTGVVPVVIKSLLFAPA